MAKIAHFRAGPRRVMVPRDPLARRTARVVRCLMHSRAAILWMCAGAGSGKSRIIEAMKPEVAERGTWMLLDEPSLEALSAALSQTTMETSVGRRLLVASRPGAAIEAILLKFRAYGEVEILDDSDIYVRPEDTAEEDAELLTTTGGWPMLVAAVLERREAAMRALLPQFLERELLPAWPVERVVYLFAALTLPLPEAALQCPGGESFVPHPLLTSDAGQVRLTSSWVREALLPLRRGEAARAVRKRLAALYSALPDPAAAIAALIDLGETAQALEVFHRAGGVYFGYRHGYHALETVLARFDVETEAGSEDLFLARLWILVKTGRTREALLRLEARHPGLPVDLRRLRVSYRPEAILLRLDCSLDLDGTPPLEVIASWARLQSFMPPGDTLGRGLLYNSMAIGYLQADALIEARQLAEEALAAYETERLPYLVHFMHVHLADVALRQGRLADAAQHVAQGSKDLEVSGQAFNSEFAILDSFRSRIAFEQGRFSECSTEIGPLLKVLFTGDSWPELIPSVASQVVLAAFWSHGLKVAAEELDRCVLAQSRRHGVTVHLRLKLLRVRLLQTARRHAQAELLLEEYEPEPASQRSAALELEEGMIRLRCVIHNEGPRAERVRLTETLRQHPALERRPRIALALLTAAAHLRDGDESAARRHVRIALREAHSFGLVAVLAEEAEALERLLPVFLSEPGPGSERLVSFAGSTLRLLQHLPAAPLNSKALAGLSRQEHRVLTYVADGCTNKQVAKALRISESTVKFHLRSLFKKLETRSRASLTEAARSRGIVT